MGLYYIKKLETKKTRTGKPYYDGDCITSDKKKVNFKVWNTRMNPLSEGDVVSANPEEKEYGGQKQLIFSEYVIKEVDKFKIVELFSDNCSNITDDFSYIKKKVGECGRFKKLVETIIADNEIDFKTAYCATSVHHDYVGGLLRHTCEVLEVADFCASRYDLDKELLLCGAILHDIGKIATYREKEPLVAEKTIEGELLDHIYIGAKIVSQYSPYIDDEIDLSLLEHVILSHHEKLEWGSPVVPKVKEACIIHYADMISSRLAIYENQLKDDSTEGLFTEKNYFLGCKIFKGEKK